MKKRKPYRNEREVKTAVTMLIVLLLLFMTGAQSFATAENGMEDKEDTDIYIQDEAADDENDQDEAVETSGASDEDTDASDETPPDASDENTDVPDEDTDKDGAEETEEAADAVTEISGEETKKDVSEEPPQKAATKATEVKSNAPVLRAAAGQRITYTGTKVGSAAGETSVFKVVSDGTTYTGTCAKQGVKMSTSGQATITKIANTSKIAKLVYHYAVEPGNANWWNGSQSTDKAGLLLGYSSANATNVTKQRLIEAFCQIYNMGDSSWYSTITNPNTGGWTAETAQKVRNLYNSINADSITVPEGFEIWYADAGNSQPFMIWAYNPAGYVTMTKKSGNKKITG